MFVARVSWRQETMTGFDTHFTSVNWSSIDLITDEDIAFRGFFFLFLVCFYVFFFVILHILQK